MLLYIGEDDLALAAGMKFTLEREEYEVETFGTCGALREAMGRWTGTFPTETGWSFADA